MNKDPYEPCACKQGKTTCGTLGRRDFLKRAAAAGATGLLADQWANCSIEALYAAGRVDDARALEASLEEWSRELEALGERRIYTGEALAHIAFPLGGIGAGQVYLLGDGRLGSWQIVNNFRSGLDAPGAFFAVRAKTASGEPVCRLLRKDGSDTDCVSDVAWSGEYPLAWLDYQDAALPVSVSLEAYSPLVPLNMKDSGLPAAVFSFQLRNNTAEAVEATVLGSIQNLVGWDGYTALSGDGLSGPEFMGNVNRAAHNERATRVSFGTQPGVMPALDKAVTLATHDWDIAHHLRLCDRLRVDFEMKDGPGTPSEKVFWFGAGSGLPPDGLWDDALDAVRAGAGLILIENGDGLLRMIGQANGKDPGLQLFADFESGYENWSITGDCFGDAPARGTLPGQQHVTGYRGRRLVNTYLNGDGSTGKAVSPPFTVAHPYIHLLVGGGNHPGLTCVNLKIGELIVYSATGRNEERLRPVVWEVSGHIGAQAIIEIVDAHTGGWGHINVDHIVFSDSAAPLPTDPEALRRFKEALPFTFSAVTAQDTPATIQADSGLPVFNALPDAYRVTGRYCAFSDFAGGADLTVAATTTTGDPVIFSAPCGKGRIVVCNGLDLHSMPGPVRKNIYGFLVAMAREATYTPQTGWPENGAHFGSMALCALAGEGQHCDALAQWENPDTLWAAFKNGQALQVASSGAEPSAPGRTWNGALASTAIVEPGETKTVVMALVWHFPNRMRDHRYGRGPRDPQSDIRLGNMYNNWFNSANEVADYVVEHFDRLREETRAFHETFYETTLPRYLLDAITANLGTMRTPLYMWLEDGTIAGYEGVDACCPMNCTHVYNYAMTPAYLFPAMERNVRETDLLTQMHPTDHYIPHRTVLPLSEPRIGFEIGGPHHPALDGELGTILKAYREYRQSGDQAWLERLWPRLKQLTNYIMERNDPDGGGVIRGEQPNTYDIHTYGSNTFIGTLYLAALRAMEEMARIMEEEALARHCRERFEAGSAGYDAACWNGAYYFNAYDAPDATPETYNQRNCWGDGCHADQLLGQWWANLLDLGYVLPEERVRGALESIYRHCWRGKLDLPEHQQRVFAEPWERGMINCAWPRDGRPKHPVLYCDEVWTGIEYEVAALLLHEGMIREALQIVKAARDRYTGNQRNPYSEIECGGHYARAMSSYSLLHAASGFHYDADKRMIGFAPRFRAEACASFFTAAAGYGLITQTRAGSTQSNAILMKRGALELESVRLAAPGNGDFRVALRPEMEHRVSMLEGHCVVTLTRPIRLKTGDRLEIELTRTETKA